MDLVVSKSNHQLPVWFSRTPYDGAQTTNALVQSWAGIHMMAYPPIALLEKTLTRSSRTRQSGCHSSGVAEVSLVRSATPDGMQRRSSTSTPVEPVVPDPRGQGDTVLRGPQDAAAA